MISDLGSYFAFTTERPLFEGEHMTFLWQDHRRCPSSQVRQILEEMKAQLPFVAWVSHYEDLTVEGEPRIGWGLYLPHRLHVLHHRWNKFHTTMWGDWKPHITPPPSMPINIRTPGRAVSFSGVIHNVR